MKCPHFEPYWWHPFVACQSGKLSCACYHRSVFQKPILSKSSRPHREPRDVKKKSLYTCHSKKDSLRSKWRKHIQSHSVHNISTRVSLTVIEVKKKKKFRHRRLDKACKRLPYRTWDFKIKKLPTWLATYIDLNLAVHYARTKPRKNLLTWNVFENYYFWKSVQEDWQQVSHLYLCCSMTSRLLLMLNR